MNKLKIIIYRWIEYGKIYKGLTPYEMNQLPYIWYDLINKKQAVFLSSGIANVLKKLKFNVELDEQKVNYIVKL